MFIPLAEIYVFSLQNEYYGYSGFQAIELMAVDAMIKANSCLDIVSCIDSPDEYWKVKDWQNFNLEQCGLKLGLRA